MGDFQSSGVKKIMIRTGPKFNFTNSPTRAGVKRPRSQRKAPASTPEIIKVPQASLEMQDTSLLGMLEALKKNVQGQLARLD
jgi:hypothetical protein